MAEWLRRLEKRKEPRPSTATYNACYEAALEVLGEEETRAEAAEREASEFERQIAAALDAARAAGVRTPGEHTEVAEYVGALARDRDRLSARVAKLRRALADSHVCATLRVADGRCDGCPTQDALDATAEGKA